MKRRVASGHNPVECVQPTGEHAAHWICVQHCSRAMLEGMRVWLKGAYARVPARCELAKCRVGPASTGASSPHVQHKQRNSRTCTKRRCMRTCADWWV